MVRALPDKQCSSDPLPTWLLKANVDILTSFLSHLFCWSLQHGVVPSRMKSAYITPILKKTNMDPVDAKSFRPISNLSVLSTAAHCQLLERLVSKQLVKYLTDCLFSGSAVCVQKILFYGDRRAHGTVRHLIGFGFW